jgi:hypothetical protein
MTGTLFTNRASVTPRDFGGFGGRRTVIDPIRGDRGGPGDNPGERLLSAWHAHCSGSAA